MFRSVVRPTRGPLVGFALGASLVGALVAAVSLVQAHNGDPAQIHACVRTAAGPGGSPVVGALRIIPPTGTCTANIEAPLDWNQPGPAGPAAPEPVLGQFIATQIAHGAIVTCATRNLSATLTECRGLKLNDLDAYLAPREANAICTAITGNGYDAASGLGVVSGPYFTWASGRYWTLGSGAISPMQNLTCKR